MTVFFHMDNLRWRGVRNAKPEIRFLAAGILAGGNWRMVG